MRCFRIEYEESDRQRAAVRYAVAPEIVTAIEMWAAEIGPKLVFIRGQSHPDDTTKRIKKIEDVGEAV